LAALRRIQPSPRSPSSRESVSTRGALSRAGSDVKRFAPRFFEVTHVRGGEKSDEPARDLPLLGGARISASHLLRGRPPPHERGPPHEERARRPPRRRLG